MQNLKKKVRFNYQDYLQTPEDKRYDLIEGDLFMVPSPSSLHQRILWNLAFRVGQFIKEKDLGELFIPPMDVVLSEEDVVQPDILFISKSRLSIISANNIRGAPDLVIEILSPGTRERDLTIKKKAYERYGVREYWVVDPEARSVEILQMTDDGFRTFRTFTQGTHLKSPLLEGLSFLIEEIFPA